MFSLTLFTFNMKQVTSKRQFHDHYKQARSTILLQFQFKISKTLYVIINQNFILKSPITV